MKTTSVILVTFLGLLFVSGCAELDESGGIGFHPPDWSKPGSSNNHRAALTEAGLPNSAMDCSGCHGADYGKPDAECFECHSTGGEYGHPDSGFIGPSGENFHGQAVIDAGGTDSCASCHAWEESGSLDFDAGGWSQQPCNTCHAGGRSGHPASPNPWFNPTATDFHGRAFKDDFAHCGECHGVDYAGGWTEVSCDAACHNPESVDFHPHGWTGDASVQSTHGFAIRSDAYLLTNCGGCHGADYLGGWSQVECNVCHAPGGIGVHPDGWVGASANEGTHGNYLAADPSFQGTCEGCHRTDLEGGWALQDCRPCHNDSYPPPRR